MLQGSQAFCGFSTNDIASTKTFYQDTLGLTVDDENGMLFIHLPGSNARVLIYPKGDGHVPAEFTVVNFPVPDLEKTVDELAAKGVTFERYEGMEQDEKGIMHGSAINMGPDIAWFTDPGGNVLSVMQQ